MSTDFCWKQATNLPDIVKMMTEKMIDDNRREDERGEDDWSVVNQWIVKRTMESNCCFERSRLARIELAGKAITLVTVEVRMTTRRKMMMMTTKRMMRMMRMQKMN